MTTTFKVAGAKACNTCCAPLVSLCPHCDLSSGPERSDRVERDTLAPEPQAEAPARGWDPTAPAAASPAPRHKRISSQPPPVPAAAAERSADRKLIERLIAINMAKLGPATALDLTDLIVEDSEDLAQDEIDALFDQ